MIARNFDIIPGRFNIVGICADENYVQKLVIK
jgi:hypothetical protein